MRLRATVILISSVLVACLDPRTGEVASQPDSIKRGDDSLGSNEAFLPVPGGRIWYREDGSGSATPVILLHGGPGLPSGYMRVFDALATERRVVRYDQLGGGQSSHVADSALTTVEHFVHELDSLRAALGFNRVHLVGHSWGTILGVEYYRAHPEHVVSLVLVSPVLDMPRWEQHAQKLLATLSDSARAAIARSDTTHDFTAPAYTQALNEYYAKYVWRHPATADLDTISRLFNPAVGRILLGPSEFKVTGLLKGYDATPVLRAVAAPTLFTAGEFDHSGPELVRRFAALTPGAEFAIIPGAAHFPMWDNPDSLFAVVHSFLRHVDSLHEGKERQ